MARELIFGKWGGGGSSYTSVGLLAFMTEMNELDEYCDVDLEDWSRAIRKVDLGFVKNCMKEAEAEFGKPQYVEWAMTIEEGEPKFWLLQVADVDERIDEIEFGNHGEIVVESKAVRGVGRENISKVVFVQSRDGLDNLRNVYKELAGGYMVVYRGNLMSGNSSFGRTGRRRLEFGDCPNAKAVVELHYNGHVSDPIGHLPEQFWLAGVFGGVISDNDWAMIKKVSTDVYMIARGLEVVDFEGVVVADERKKIFRICKR